MDMFFFTVIWDRLQGEVVVDCNNYKGKKNNHGRRDVEMCDLFIAGTQVFCFL